VVACIRATDQSGLGCDSERARSGLAGAVAEVVSAGELIAASWADGSTAAAGRAVMAAAGAYKAVSQRAAGLCDGLDPRAHHPFGPLAVRPIAGIYGGTAYRKGVDRFLSWTYPHS